MDDRDRMDKTKIGYFNYLTFYHFFWFCLTLTSWYLEPPSVQAIIRHIIFVIFASINYYSGIQYVVIDIMKKKKIDYYVALIIYIVITLTISVISWIFNFPEIEFLIIYILVIISFVWIYNMGINHVLKKLSLKTESFSVKEKDESVEKRPKGFAKVIADSYEPLNNIEEFKNFFKEVRFKILINPCEEAWAALICVDHGVISIQGITNRPKENLLQEKLGWKAYLETTLPIFIELGSGRISTAIFLKKVIFRKIKVKYLRNLKYLKMMSVFLSTNDV